MNFFKFWVRSNVQPDGLKFPVTGFGYSNQSLDDALRVATERAAATAAAIQSSAGVPRKELYYGDRPIREEIIEEFQLEGQLVAVLTRNSYGALILNAARVLFADIDLADPKQGLLGSLFGKKAADPSQALIEQIQAMTDRDPTLGIRLYRTFNGFRCVVTSREFDPSGPASTSLLEELNSDPMYIRLCKSQKCFRARLSPKPWRIGMKQPRWRYPFENQDREADYRTWVGNYTEQAAGYATCAFIGQFGDESVPEPIRVVVDLHDHYCLSGDKPIA